MNIIIREIDETISYDSIHELLILAHEKNVKNGITMNTINLSGEQLKHRIGADGVTLVALDDDKLIGTLSIRFVERNNWYVSKKIPEFILLAILPEYQGEHIGSKLIKEGFDIVNKMGYSLIELDTAEKNKNAIKVYEHFGFKKVNFVAFENVDHYSVFMVKWLNNCPFSDIYIFVRYFIRKVLVKTRYKVGRKKRFGI